MVKFFIRILVTALAIYYLTACVGGLKHLANPKVNIFKFAIPFYYWVVIFKNLKKDKTHVEKVSEEVAHKDDGKKSLKTKKKSE